MPRVLAKALTAYLLAISIAMPSSRARAAHVPQLEVAVIHAIRTDGGSSIDPELRNLPQLTREQPFVRYNVYRLLDRKQMPIEEGKSVVDGLVNGRTLQVTLLGVTEAQGEKRYRLRAAIDEPGKVALLKLLEVTAAGNEPFFVGGQGFRGGVLFLELVVRP